MPRKKISEIDKIYNMSIKNGDSKRTAWDKAMNAHLNKQLNKMNLASHFFSSKKK